MKIVILDGYGVNPGDLSWNELSDFGHVTVYDRTPADSREILSRARGAEILITNKTYLSRELIFSLLPELRYIGLLSTGTNAVDLIAAHDAGIPVTNIPSYSTDAVAQMTLALLLEAVNQVGLHNQAVHSGKWSQCTDFCFWLKPQLLLSGKTLGLVGYGNIGRRVAAIAWAFGMRVQAHTRHPFSEEHVPWVDRDTLFSTSDVISLHCPLTEENAGMINRNTIAGMKSGVILINTSRGGLLVEEDLKEGLLSGKIAYACLDVLGHEPPPVDHPLMGIPNCLITPHIAWAPLETRARLISVAADNVRQFLRGTPIHTV